MGSKGSAPKSCACGATGYLESKYRVGEYVTKKTEIKEGNKYVIEDIKYKIKNQEYFIFDSPKLEFEPVYKLKFISKPVKTEPLNIGISADGSPIIWHTLPIDSGGSLTVSDYYFSNSNNGYEDEDDLVEWTEMNEVLYNE